MTLTDFLLARIAEDEQRAEGVESITYTPRWKTNGEFAISTTRLDDWQAHMLAECEAKRRIVEMYRGLVETQTAVHALDDLVDAQMIADAAEVTARAVVQIHATVYADHPDYREEWRP